MPEFLNLFSFIFILNAVVVGLCFAVEDNSTGKINATVLYYIRYPLWQLHHGSIQQTKVVIALTKE